MKFYNEDINGPVELLGKDAQEHCKQCEFGHVKPDGEVTCILGSDILLIDDATANSDIVCW